MRALVVISTQWESKILGYMRPTHEESMGDKTHK